MCFILKMICLFLVFVLFALFVLHLFQEERIYNEIQNIPGPPLMPHFKSEKDIDFYLKDALNNIEKLRREYGSVVRLRAGSKVVVLLTEPKYVEQLLQSGEITCEGAIDESILIAEKINQWITSKIGPFFTKFKSALNRKPILADLELLTYVTRAFSPKTARHTQRNKAEFPPCLFKTDQIPKSADAKLRQKLAGKMPRESQTDSIVDFLVASALNILANNPGIQYEAFKEISLIFGRKEINFENVKKLETAERVLKKVIRPYISETFLVKTLRKKIKFGVTSVPAGVEIVILLSGDCPTHSKPPDFNGNTENASPNIKLNSCVGEKYIMQRAKTTLTKLVRKYEVLSSQEENGLPFKLKPRR